MRPETSPAYQRAVRRIQEVDVIQSSNTHSWTTYVTSGGIDTMRAVIDVYNTVGQTRLLTTSENFYIVQLVETYLENKFSEINQSRIFYDNDTVIVELKIDMEISIDNEKAIIEIENKLIKQMEEKGINIDFRHHLV